MKLTRDEIQAKSDATRLRNLRSKQAGKETLTTSEKSVLLRLGKKENESNSQIETVPKIDYAH
jgi:hypothetical protein